MPKKLSMLLPADHQPTKVVEPGKQSFRAPTSWVAAQGTTILRWLPGLSAMRSAQCRSGRPGCDPIGHCLQALSGITLHSHP
jgi:hypothetical protein